jgi:hypothetical protein
MVRLNFNVQTTLILFKQFFMKIQTFLLLLSVNLLIITQLKGQNWGTYGPVVSQLDSSKRVDYNNNLIILQNFGSINTLPIGGAMDSLNIALNGSNPTSGLDTMLPTNGVIRNGVISYLDTKNYSFLDSTTVIRQLDTLILFGNTRKDTINGLFGTYHNNLTGTNELPTNYGNNSNSTWNNAQDSLRNNQLQSFSANPKNGVKNFKQLFDNLFSPQLFTRMEMFAGKQNSYARYYNYSYNSNLPVIGIRSSEQFTSKWEARWRAQTSWIFKDRQIVSSEGVVDVLKKNTPFLMNANFDMMYNPTIMSLPGSNGQLRLLSLLGIDGATYVPAHRTTGTNSLGANNVGYTTGWGPIIGAGLSLKKTNVTIFAISTISYGNVVCFGDYRNSNYKYTSTRVEAGIRYLNKITVRFENGLSNNWAALGGKNVRYTQVTVGLPTNNLFRR